MMRVVYFGGGDIEPSRAFADANGEPRRVGICAAAALAASAFGSDCLPMMNAAITASTATMLANASGDMENLAFFAIDNPLPGIGQSSRYRARITRSRRLAQSCV